MVYAHIDGPDFYVRSLYVDQIILGHLSSCCIEYGYPVLMNHYYQLKTFCSILVLSLQLGLLDYG